MKRILVQFITIISVVSCNFLDLMPIDTYTVENTYKAPADFELAIAGVYDAQQSLYYDGECWFRTSFIRGDEVRAGSGGTHAKGISTFTETSSVPALENAYKRFWQIINRANLILDKIDPVKFLDESAKRHIKGEAYALRGWAYYTLAWQFGGMPLIDTEITLGSTMLTPRSTQSETIDFAAEDLRLAIGLLPEKWEGKNLGRVTKYAALSALGRLYMFTHDYRAAENCFKQVIDSGLYEMEENYVDCFTDSHDNGKERVWEVQFCGGQRGEGNKFITGLLPEGYNTAGNPDELMPFNGYSSAMMIALDLMDCYETGDIRKDVSTVTNIEINGVMERVYSYIIKYVHWDEYKPQAKDDWANNLPIIRYTDVLMMYAEALNEQAYSAGGEAFVILNKVRERAGLAPKTASELHDQDSFRKALMAERRVEFAFEGYRWHDLLRWDTAMQAMLIHFKYADNAGSYSMASHNKLFPIPYAEILRYDNPSVMWQNPGY
jgi:tetratricopeptide (TPR) repeat protein